MAKFALIYTGGGFPESEAEKAEMMAAWSAWYQDLGPAIVDAGNPCGAAKSVSRNGASVGAASSPAPNGYTIIDADSLDEAVGRVKSHPHLNYGGQVSVCATFDM